LEKKETGNPEKEEKEKKGVPFQGGERKFTPFKETNAQQSPAEGEEEEKDEKKKEG